MLPDQPLDFPNPNEDSKDRLEGMAWLKAEATVGGEQTRDSVEAWANLTFAGEKDASGHTIV